MVDVLMLTYNHSSYIRKAIESVLSQKTTFRVKLIIADDASTDNTPAIVSEFAARYPEKIMYVRNARNIGVQDNFIKAYKSSNGKYLAICEGDDYWTDESKLQKQIDFLENNPDFAICYHNLKILSGDTETGLFYPAGLNKKDVTDFYDLASSIHIANPSVVSRRNPIAFPEWFKDVVCGDYVLHLLNAQFGKIKYLDEVLSVYRVHDSGAWNGLKEEKRLENLIYTIGKTRQYFAPVAGKEFLRYEIMLKADLCFLKFDEKKHKDYRRLAKDLIAQHNLKISARILKSLTVRYLASLLLSERK